MQALLNAMLEDSAIKEMAGQFRKSGGQAFVYGLAGTQKHSAFAACYLHNTAVIVTSGQQELNGWREDLQCLLPETEILELPVLDMVEFNAAAKGLHRLARRMEVLGRLLKGERLVVLATVEAAMQKGIGPAAYRELSLVLERGMLIGREKLLQQLVKLGYERSDQVEMAGDFSVRGGIVDVFPLNSPHPCRIEFFDDEIESIRQFNIGTQLSIDKLDEVEILPFGGVAEKQRKCCFMDFLPEDGTVIIDEPLKAREASIKLIKENPDIRTRMFSWEELNRQTEGRNVILLALMLYNLHNAALDRIISVKVNGVTSYQKQMDMLVSEAQDWLSAGQGLIMTLGDMGKSGSLKELFGRHRLAAVETDAAEPVKPGRINLVQGALLNGFELPGAKLVLVTEKDIFGRQKKRLSRVSSEERINSFREINVGDYVVHTQHGIGKYMGVETVEIEGIRRDYLRIQYGGDDKLFVPTDQVGMLQKYIGSEGEIPRLHRMGSTAWAKAKSRAKSAVEDIAQDLIRLYAQRKKTRGFAFGPDTVWQREFEDAFPFEETPDQLSAINDIKKDMERQQPMDRLLCGDVGFGKTEVAVRAAFKAVMGGKQVAVLVPTTVLAQQHYQTFEERFRNFGPSVDVINRFRSPKEQKSILERTREGRVDILIGTHALLNQKKVQFKDLGLLIVDEEQRFGVKQKEKIKSLALGIDVLTLSATPIPRTLHMSLAGARDMSIIGSPPQERFPVQTYVVENSNGIIRNAIHRELKRGGQIYFVYNRVETIEQMKLKLEEIVPDAVIQIAHGQMPEAQLERVMVEFYEGKYDILLATSIIESGLDIANANTIIIYDADRFGLAQLYQMRGRVGRSHHLAYAYLLYQQNKVLSEVAEKRLQAIKEFAELGAGFKIAMRDLEIRGAGDLLGAQQHGHIASVGFEMYCRLLDEAMQQIKTGKPVEVIPEPLIEIPVEAYLDSDYIGDAMHKIEIYQKIAAVRDNDQLEAVLAELTDRFGEPPVQVLNLLDVARVRNYARRIGIEKIVQTPMFLEIYFRGAPNIRPEGMLTISQELKSAMKVLQERNLMRIALRALARKRVLDFVLDIVEKLAA
ncbi:transcription-repair coupling factor [Anaerovibrio sp.]|uniref:transcription-repair coupling factor n=1 Tax=Anaerovibrio sp. TaxID=1872532 RepID=UPI003F17D44A